MKKITVLCFGTFDNLHPGHISYLEQAKKNGDRLVVVVARDKNVIKIKGQAARQDENERLRGVRRLDLVDRAILGKIKDRMLVVKKLNPNKICLGYDQSVDIIELKKIFKGKTIRCRAFKPNKYKSSLKRKNK
jgi:FAD synthetase